MTQTQSESETKLEALEDHFAEAQDAIEHIQGALRHYQQPQDATFHRALKAIRDGKDLITRLRAEPSWAEGIEAAAKIVEAMPMKSSDRADLMAMLLIKQCAVDRIRSLITQGSGTLTGKGKK